MKKALLLSALSFCIVSPVAAEDGHVAVASEAPAAVVAPVVKEVMKHKGPNWGYTGAGAAYKWGDLAAQFEVCKKGVQQSPINIDKFVQEALPPLSASYKPSPLVVVNNGHTVHVDYEPGSGFRADDKNFSLLQLHFHTPSEHYIDGAPYPMEVHFVHKAEDGTLGVIGVMFKVGAHNPTIEGIWQNVPKAGQAKAVDMVQINAADLMPDDKGYYKYDGSLTTPPCTEGVKWYVMEDPVEISAAQLTAFQAVFPVNARPIQDINGRTVKGD